jgi:hypothetical protein
MNIIDRRNGANDLNFNQYPFPSSPFAPSFSPTSSELAFSFFSGGTWSSSRDGSTIQDQTSTQELQPTRPTQPVGPPSPSSSVISTSTLTPDSSASSLSSTSTRSSGTTLYVMAQSSPHTFHTSSIPVRRPTSTEYVSFIPTNPTPDSTSTRSPIRLSTTAIGILTALAATLTFFFTICMFRCIRRHMQEQRRLKDSFFDSSTASGSDNEKNANGSILSGVGKSPSTIFGGKERTGLTPHPSWITFNDGMGTIQESDRSAPSPYPLGLVPPPVQRQPSLRGHNGFGLGVVQPNINGTSGPRIGHGNASLNRQNPQFCPPTITITSSSPRSSLNASIIRPFTTTDARDMSPSNSLGRVSVYDHPTRGAQLVNAPKLRVVGEEVDGVTRNSGWSSWDDGIGLEMGATLDRRVCIFTVFTWLCLTGIIAPGSQESLQISKFQVKAGTTANEIDITDCCRSGRCF